MRCVWKAAALLGEGPLWSPKEHCLYWVDIKGRAIHRYCPDHDIRQTFMLEEEIGCIALRKSGGFVAGMRSGLVFLEPGNEFSIRPVVAPERTLPGNRFNDGKCDRFGRFWAGTMDDVARQTTGALYRLSPDLILTRMLSDIIVSNGIAWSPDDRIMYFTDSENRTIFAFDDDAESGEISRQRVFARVADGSGLPDGLTVDAEGFVWSAHWDGWRITRYNPAGDIDRVIHTPVPRPTSCAFGGDELDKLYVTSASAGLSPAQIAEAPLSGGLFEVDVGVCGLPEPLFGG